MALDSAGNIYISNTLFKVTRYSPSGVLMGTFVTAGTDALINGIAFDAAGNFYAADYANGRVNQYNSSGSLLSYIGSPGSGDGNLNGPVSVAVDASGKIYVGDANNNRIVVFNAAGVFLKNVGPTF